MHYWSLIFWIVNLFSLQTVAPQEATSFARSLPQQPVNKGKVWLVFLAGATGLFGAAVAIEKNSSLFPAIAKANQAMAATKAAQKASHALLMRNIALASFCLMSKLRARSHNEIARTANCQIVGIAISLF